MESRMTKMTIVLSEAERDALFKICLRELRSMQAQARYLIRSELVRLGGLPDDAGQSDARDDSKPLELTLQFDRLDQVVAITLLYYLLVPDERGLEETAGSELEALPGVLRWLMEEISVRQDILRGLLGEEAVTEILQYLPEERSGN